MKFYGGLFVLFLGAFTLFCASVAQGPDFEITFNREVRVTEASHETLARAMADIRQWPRWFHSLKQAQAERTEVQAGSEVTLFIEPIKKEWKRFTLETRVTEFTPGRSLELEVLKDSKDKLTSVFDKLTWRVELASEAGVTVIRGTCVGVTKNWRSRLFGKIAARILMHQVYYMDLVALGRLRLQPFPI